MQFWLIVSNVAYTFVLSTLLSDLISKFTLLYLSPVVSALLEGAKCRQRDAEGVEEIGNGSPTKGSSGVS